MIVWRRFHSPELVANILQSGPHTYAVAVWKAASDSVSRAPRTFRSLESAMAAADDLLRRTFKHRCTVEQCGGWVLWASS